MAMMEELVRAGGPVDATTHLGDTALIGAAYQGHAEVVRFLVEEAGATLDVHNEEGDTALDLASTSAIREILSNPPTRRHYPLHRAAELGNLEAIQMQILKRQVDCNLRGRYGETPLMLCSLKVLKRLSL
mmetsp:Transcript_27895/g.61028  ORF Transcript_27895/g.61028 Transcript_27895/m.61028 type:complete len:130 (+) Transcript_27895:252-641(+)